MYKFFSHQNKFTLYPVHFTKFVSNVVFTTSRFIHNDKKEGERTRVRKIVLINLCFSFIGFSFDKKNSFTQLLTILDSVYLLDVTYI